MTTHQGTDRDIDQKPGLQIVTGDCPAIRDQRALLQISWRTGVGGQEMLGGWPAGLLACWPTQGVFLFMPRKMGDMTGDSDDW